MDYNDENPVFLLFEGVCPECHCADVRMVSIGGTEDFHSNQAFDSDAEIIVWKGRPEGDPVDGGIEFKCNNDNCLKEFYISHNIYGDWN